MSFPRFGVLLLLAALAVGPSAVRADGDAHEQDEAHGAVQRGAIRPLSEIFAKLPRGSAADVVRVKLKLADGRWVYELRLMDAQGRLRDIVVDASTGTERDEGGD